MKSTLKQKIATWGLIGASSIASLFNGGCQNFNDFKTSDGQCYREETVMGILYRCPTCDYENGPCYDIGWAADYWQPVQGGPIVQKQRYYPSPGEKVGTDVATWGLINALTGQ